MSIYNLGGEAITNAYDLSGNLLSAAYDIEGAVIHPDAFYELSLLHSQLMSNLASGTITPQGMAIHGDYLFQFFTGDNRIRIFNRHNYSLVASYSATDIAHANTMQFGVVEEDTGFPLLYVSEWGHASDTDSKQVDILKVSLNGYEVAETYTLPASVGYHPCQIIDWENEKIYVVGYANSLSTSTSQPQIITALRLSDKTIIDQWQVPYMGVMNGLEFYNGKLIYYGNGWDSDTLDLFLIDVSTHDSRMLQYPKTTNEEYEDCSRIGNTLYLSNWVYDANDGNKLKYRLFAMMLSDYEGYKGKTISVLGDSISTFAGFIPSGNANFYTGSNCGVVSAYETWWMKLINALGMTLEINNSWSGSRVSTTNGIESAGVTRASNLGENPNVVIVYMGINDFNNEVDPEVFRSAYATMLENIKTAYPNAKVFCATLPPCERNGSVGDPEINDSGVALSDWNQIIMDVAASKNIKILDFTNCGITYANMQQYMGDWESATGMALHPNAEGHGLLASKAIAQMIAIGT